MRRRLVLSINSFMFSAKMICDFLLLFSQSEYFVVTDVQESGVRIYSCHPSQCSDSPERSKLRGADCLDCHVTSPVQAQTLDRDTLFWVLDSLSFIWLIWARLPSHQIKTCCRSQCPLQAKSNIYSLRMTKEASQFLEVVFSEYWVNSKTLTLWLLCNWMHICIM